MASLYDLMKETFEAQKWLVEGLIPEGIVLIAGKPKVGKSWFALDLLLAARMNAKFLGKPVMQCGALYLALEDTERRLQSRVQMLLERFQGQSADFLKDLHYEVNWKRGEAGALALQDWLKDHPECKVVVVDVLKRIRPADAPNKNDYDKDYEAVEPWKKVAEQYGITLVLVHHARKAEADDVFDEISGTLGLNGVVDHLIVLRKSGDKGAVAHMRGRDLPDDVELGLELRDGWWEYVGNPREIEASRGRKAVLEALRSAGKPLVLSALLAATGKKSGPSLHHMLKSMVEDGLVEKTPSGYSISASSLNI